jgi:hypothetical protein
MDWINIHTSTLDSEEFLGCEPVDQATWLKLTRYCAGQENGGRIITDPSWGDRRWQQVFRVTLQEVQRPCPLWSWDANVLTVAFYPIEAEEKVRINRTNGNRGGRPKKNPVDNHMVTVGGTMRFDSAETKRNERKGNEKEGNETTAPVEPDVFDQQPESPAPTRPPTDDELWTYQESPQPWAQVLKAAGCKITKTSWRAWKGALERAYAGDHEAMAQAALTLPAEKRWVDQVEALREQKKPEPVDDTKVAGKLHRAVAGIVGGEVFCKAVDLLKAAKRYGIDEIIALANHAKENGGGLSKDLANIWFKGRPSNYGGWDGYEPKTPLETPLTTEQILESITEES